MKQQLSYEIRKTAANLFAGRTGFSLEEMQDFFREEIEKRLPRPQPFGRNSLLSALSYVSDSFAYTQKLHQLDEIEERKGAFEAWLAALPLTEQVDLLLMLCRKPNFPMKFKVPSLTARRELAALLDEFVINASVAPALQQLHSASVTRAWEKAMDRCESDPSGAITAARSMLESVCKHLLDGCGVTYGRHEDLPNLYHHLTTALHIAPNQQSDAALRQIVGGSHSVLNGLATLRNQLGDSHGRGEGGIEPTPSQAKLAVNLAGSLAQFLIQTWEEYQLAHAPVLAIGDTNTTTD